MAYEVSTNQRLEDLEQGVGINDEVSIDFDFENTYEYVSGETVIYETNTEGSFNLDQDLSAGWLDNDDIFLDNDRSSIQFDTDYTSIGHTVFDDPYFSLDDLNTHKYLYSNVGEDGLIEDWFEQPAVADIGLMTFTQNATEGRLYMSDILDEVCTVNVITGFVSRQFTKLTVSWDGDATIEMYSDFDTTLLTSGIEQTYTNSFNEFKLKIKNKGIDDTKYIGNLIIQVR